MKKVEDLLRLASASEKCSVFDDELAQIVEEDGAGYLDDVFLEYVAAGVTKKNIDDENV